MEEGEEDKKGSKRKLLRKIQRRPRFETMAFSAFPHFCWRADLENITAKIFFFIIQLNRSRIGLSAEFVLSQVKLINHIFKNKFVVCITKGVRNE